MSQFDELFENVKNSDDYEQNARLMHFVGNVLKNARRTVSDKDAAEIKSFALGEMDKLTAKIPAAESYEKKDEMFFYEDALLMVFTLVAADKSAVDDADVQTVKRLVDTVSAERTLENAVNDMFERDGIDVADVNKVLEIVKPIKDEYRRGLLYNGLHEYCEKIKSFTADAKSALAEYVADDMTRILDGGEIDKHKAAALEYAADVCKFFINDRIAAILERAISLGINRVNYYAVETLLEYGMAVSADTVKALAEDLSCAELTYRLLEKHGKTALFPAALATPEYLAKSDLVHWLCYPTELNKPPYEIELLGAIKVKGELFHVFKYKTDSDNLSEDLRDVDLVGWSGNEGGTFSNFDPLSDFQKKTPQKTLKYIAKKLLR